MLNILRKQKYSESLIYFPVFLFLVWAVVPVLREWRVEERISFPTLAQLFLE